MDVGRRVADEAAIFLFQRLPRRGMPLLFAPSTLACVTSAHHVRDLQSPSRRSAGKTYASLCVVLQSATIHLASNYFSRRRLPVTTDEKCRRQLWLSYG